MTTLMLTAGMTTGTQLAIAVGVIAFVLLFFKLVTSFIKFCFRHPVIFVLLLLCGGLGFIFNFLLAGILIIAVIIGGVAFFIANEFGG
ncbi:hypothetical protein [Loigolactobacillus jiayinensis]|uniref:Uncharacterized protein n=1 Tax=Loigolactobacillus jiayinensis TaxID=2486016 RepID=A0ABW1RE18_9LACO|nr:hypothetical protein [Loigolactobacillus jiayinensis]